MQTPQAALVEMRASGRNSAENNNSWAKFLGHGEAFEARIGILRSEAFSRLDA